MSQQCSGREWSRAGRLARHGLHRFWGPLACALVVVAAGLPSGYLVGVLAWAVHVAFDRAIGLPLRLRNGFQQPLDP